MDSFSPDTLHKQKQAALNPEKVEPNEQFATLLLAYGFAVWDFLEAAFDPDCSGNDQALILSGLERRLFSTLFGREPTRAELEKLNPATEENRRAAHILMDQAEQTEYEYVFKKPYPIRFAELLRSAKEGAA